MLKFISKCLQIFVIYTNLMQVHTFIMVDTLDKCPIFTDRYMSTLLRHFHMCWVNLVVFFFLIVCVCVNSQALSVFGILHARHLAVALDWNKTNFSLETCFYPFCSVIVAHLQKYYPIAGKTVLQQFLSIFSNSLFCSHTAKLFTASFLKFLHQYFLYLLQIWQHMLVVMNF